MGLRCGCLKTTVRALTIFPCCHKHTCCHLNPARSHKNCNWEEKKREIGEFYRSVVLGCPGQRAAVLGQEAEIVGTPIAHIKAEAAKFGLGLVCCSIWEAHHWKMWHASGAVPNLPRVINFWNPLIILSLNDTSLKMPFMLFSRWGLRAAYAAALGGILGATFLASYIFWQGKEKSKTREAFAPWHVEGQVKEDICGPILLLLK